MNKALMMIATVASFCSAFIEAAHGGALLEVEGNVLRWEQSAPGGGAEITYALLKEPYTVPSGKRVLSPDNCPAMHAFADIVAVSPEISEENARSELRAAFAAWSSEARLTFVEVDELSRANIIIGAQDQPAGRAFANLSYSGGHYPAPTAKALGKPAPDISVDAGPAAIKSGGAHIEQAYICLNPRMRWKIGFDGNLDVYDLRYTFTHEIGHAIGLDHPGSAGSMMGYRYDERVQRLQPQDIAAVQELYGASTAGE